MTIDDKRREAMTFAARLDPDRAVSLTTDEFEAVVGMMRILQTEFFKVRNADVLRASKRIERFVDAVLAARSETHCQGRMF